MLGPLTDELAAVGQRGRGDEIVRRPNKPKPGPMQHRGRMAANVDIAERGIEYARAFAGVTSFSSDWFIVGYREQVAGSS
jgi:hypothetical protein